MTQSRLAARHHDGALALVHSTAILLPATVALTYTGGLSRWTVREADPLGGSALWVAVAVLAALVPFVVTGAYAVRGRQHERSWVESVQPATPFVVALGVVACLVTAVTTGGL